MLTFYLAYIKARNRRVTAKSGLLEEEEITTRIDIDEGDDGGEGTARR
jgi:hypothetical protein